jgi:hypothetical protein
LIYLPIADHGSELAKMKSADPVTRAVLGLCYPGWRCTLGTKLHSLCLIRSRIGSIPRSLLSHPIPPTGCVFCLPRNFEQESYYSKKRTRYRGAGIPGQRTRQCGGMPEVQVRRSDYFEQGIPPVLGKHAGTVRSDNVTSVTVFDYFWYIFQCRAAPALGPSPARKQVP